jgi:hypothetical protein
MKRFALLCLENNANKVILDTNAITLTDAIDTFNLSMVNGQLDKNGYCKMNDAVTLCIAEYFQPFYTI